FSKRDDPEKKSCLKKTLSEGEGRMADIIEYKIYGDDMQVVEVELDPGEAVRAEAGAMMYMDDGIEMQTSAEGGIFKGFKRMLTGESFFITTFLNGSRRTAVVAFGAPYPGKIIPLHLAEIGGEMICQKDAFLCAAKGIDINIAFTKKIGTGLFGGEGFILQRLTGDGLVFIHAGGTIIKRELSQGQTVKVDTGCIAAFSPSVHYDIKFVGGFTNALFGGEGLFLATLTGPGSVYLQSLPFSRLADRIKAAIGSGREESRGIGGIGKNILGDVFGGDHR
ncbi:MAG: TIGR00266 family protein, partial [Chitinivibrionales bacterium]|nr:TIGR00266 family protein [Chitinivibrionales bacterium]